MIRVVNNEIPKYMTPAGTKRNGLSGSHFHGSDKPDANTMRRHLIYTTRNAPFRKILSILLLLMPAAGIRSQSAVPPFAIVCVDDSSRLISNESIKGKFCLIDFWASWCPPCVEEIPELTRVFEKYKSRNFEVLSMSFDKTPEQLQRFRKKRFPMAWLHAWVEDGFGSHLARMFDVQNIPHQILVSPDGLIVAVDEELRGHKLEETIKKYLKE